MRLAFCVVKDAVNGAKTSTELVELASANGGDEFMAVKPWLGAIVPPTRVSKKGGPKETEEASTDVDLTLAWVFGYRSQGKGNDGCGQVPRVSARRGGTPRSRTERMAWADCRNNLRYTSGGDILYVAAALGIVYHKNKNDQSFFQVGAMSARP